MNLYWLIPIIIGTITVLQGTLNRNMGASFGLGTAVFLNSAIVMLMGTVLFGLVWRQPELFPPLFRGDFSWQKVSWWMILPGIFGFCIITGIPWAISKLGAAKVFVAIIAAQIVASMLWDAITMGKMPGMYRLLGAGLTVAGAVLVSLDNS